MRIVNVDGPVIFDTDCLLGFASVDNGMDLIFSALPDPVTTDFVLQEISCYWNSAHAVILDAVSSSRLGEYRIRVNDAVSMETFRELTNPERSMIRGPNGKRLKILGDGEAAAIALVRAGGGTVASNNLSDISDECHQLNIPFICTDDILCISVINGKTTLEKATLMWEQIRKSTTLPRYGFAEAYRRFRLNQPR